MKLAVAYAFIGVIGSEFIMSRGGIGYEISFAYANFDNATMYPLILLILLASVAINGVLSRWEQRLLAAAGACDERGAAADGQRALAATHARADRGAARALAGLYWWVGDVALASPLATLRYTAKLFASESFDAQSVDTLRAFAIAYALVGRHRARWSGSGSASTGCRATRWSR